MLVYGPSQMRDIDKYTINVSGISEDFLMDKAASAVFDQIKATGDFFEKTFSVICGKGNNAADSLILAKKLIKAGSKLKIFIIPEIKTLEGTVKKVHDELLNTGAEISQFSSDSDITADILIDGIFGTGFRGMMPEPYLLAIEKINNSAAFVVSVDIPSGLDGLSGDITQNAVLADLTITFGAPKTGFFNAGGPGCVGRLVVSDIGLTKEAFDSVKSSINFTDEKLIKDIMPKRKVDSNKGDFGKTLIIAGSAMMPGAGVLCAKAAYTAGAGYVYALTEDTNRLLYAIHVPELLHVNDHKNKKYDSISIGPGMGATHKTYALLEDILLNFDKNLVIDADAINCIKDPAILLEKKSRVLLTPHPKEMSRLTGKSVEYINNNRIDVCCEFSQTYNVLTLLKGRFSVISDEKGKVYINPTGNVALAKAGTGDVLTGIASGFAANCDLLDAAILSAYIHGLCADIYVKENSSFSLLASELIEIVPKAIKTIINELNPL